MRIKLNYIAPLLAAGAAVAAIAAAPTAAAANVNNPSEDLLPSCTYVGGGFYDNQCQTPGNAQLNDNLPYVQNPYYGGFGGGDFGGNHGGHR
ncbi:MAG: hypothetical protein JWR32_3930 [Mycobacterium sp.]|jgi:hypothetical protein|nr:hypothetical protein [Mycobacterium sp.]